MVRVEQKCRRVQVRWASWLRQRGVAGTERALHHYRPNKQAETGRERRTGMNGCKKRNKQNSMSVKLICWLRHAGADWYEEKNVGGPRRAHLAVPVSRSQQRGRSLHGRSSTVRRPDGGRQSRGSSIGRLKLCRRTVGGMKNRREMKGDTCAETLDLTDDLFMCRLGLDAIGCPISGRLRAAVSTTIWTSARILSFLPERFGNNVLQCCIVRCQLNCG